jgi:hypothetical protein
LTNGKKRSHSDIQNYLLRQKWITTDEIIAFEQKIEAKVQLADFGKGNWEPIAELTKFTYSENKMQ